MAIIAGNAKGMLTRNDPATKSLILPNNRNNNEHIRMPIIIAHGKIFDNEN
jgi:hypothetical protein